MSVVRLLVREIGFRPLNFISAALAVFIGVALTVGVITMCEASQRETVRLMRNLGFNVLIVPEGVEMANFWGDDYAAAQMPEDYVYKLSQSHILTVRHLVARLQKKIQWRGHTILLTGILPEVPMAHRSTKKEPMGIAIPRGKALVGAVVAAALSIEQGDVLEFGDVDLVVDRVLDEQGAKDDIRIYGHLHDVQTILNMPDLINEIEALGCLCKGKRDPARVRSDVQSVLPGTQVVEFRNIAVAREQTRHMIEKQAAIAIPVVLLVCGVWVALMALGNVRERRGEIGILRAIGASSTTIAATFMLKAILIGAVGAVPGFAIGSWLSMRIGPQVFPLTGIHTVPQYGLLGWALVVAPILCVIATYIPAVVAVTQDPADVLREE